jgi:hypothetical protein
VSDFQVWHLWRGADPYTLIVYPDPVNGSWDVEIHEEHVHPETRNPLTFLGATTLARDTHIVGDCWDAVREAMEQRVREREEFNRDPFGDLPEWAKFITEQIGSDRWES